MMSAFETLIEWLFATRPVGSVPQLGVADSEKRALIWLPGKTAKLPGATVDAGRARYLGCTNRAYESHSEAMDGQQGWICAAMIDIDHHDQPTLKLREMIDRVIEACGDEPVSIRTSCGGRGLHLIRRLAHPVAVPPGAGSTVYNAATRLINRGLVDALEEAGIEVCQFDSRMFWLHGGENRWIVQSEGLCSFAPGLLDTMVPGRVGPRRPAPKLPGGLDPFVSGWLIRLQVSPGPVYVGDVVTKLRGMGETVNTKSPMTGNGAVNGYVDVRPGEIGLWSYADGRTIWRAMDESVWDAPMTGDME